MVSSSINIKDINTSYFRLYIKATETGDPVDVAFSDTNPGFYRSASLTPTTLSTSTLVSGNRKVNCIALQGCNSGLPNSKMALLAQFMEKNAEATETSDRLAIEKIANMMVGRL